MCATKRRRERGMIMIFVLLLVAILLIVAWAVISGTSNAASSVTAVSIKNRVLNSAEGGMNNALDSLAQNPALPEGTTLSGDLNAATWEATIAANNLLSGQQETIKDPATGQPVNVPPHEAYLYAWAGDDNTGRTTYVEALASPAPPLTLPPGVLNAGGNIHDNAPMAISADPSDPNPNDANVYANLDIFGSDSTVAGNTFAGGDINELPGVDGQRHTHAPMPRQLPSANEVLQAARTAGLSAQAGTVLQPGDIAPNQQPTYTGNVYVNGNLNITSGMITFAQGAYVYINGDLCVNDSGQVRDFNPGVNVIVVAGNLQIGNAGYSIQQGQNTLTLVLGKDGGNNSCGTAHAVDFQTLSLLGAKPVGTIFAPNGSVALTGDGSLFGAIDAGLDILIDGTDAKAGMGYDSTQALTTMNTGTLTYQSYIEY